MIEIDYRHLSPEVLDDLIEHVVTRGGTDYGEVEVSLMDKKNQLYQSLVSGEAIIIYDADSDLCDIVSKDNFNQCTIH